MFNNGFWQLIFRGVLLPIFDNVRYAGEKDLIQEVIYINSKTHFFLYRIMNG